MAFISWQAVESGELLFMRFDATVTDGHLGQVDIPEHAVESGENVSDHVRRKPDSVNLEIQISNTPVYYFGRVAESMYPKEAGQEIKPMVMAPEVVDLGITEPPIRIFTGIAPINLPFPPRKPIKVTVKRVTNYIDRVAAVYDQLDLLMKSGQLLRVHTSLRPYEDMLITSLDTSRNAAKGNAADISIALKQIRIADTQTVPLPKEPRGKKGKDDDKPTVDANPEEQRKSFFMQSFGALAGL